MHARILFLAAIVAAAVQGAGCAAPRRVPPGVVIGDALVPAEIVPFARVDADPSAYFERTLLVEATVVAVCRMSGCWMQVEDEGRSAMVRWQTGCGGRYAFPPEAQGRRVLVQGSFYPKSISADEAEHLEMEAGEGLEVEREGYEFNASAIVVLEAS